MDPNSSDQPSVNSGPVTSAPHIVVPLPSDSALPPQPQAPVVPPAPEPINPLPTPTPPVPEPSLPPQPPQPQNPVGAPEPITQMPPPPPPVAPPPPPPPVQAPVVEEQVTQTVTSSTTLPQDGVSDSNSGNVKEVKNRRFNKKIGLAVVVVILLLALPLTIFLSQQQQTIEQNASEPVDANTLVTVGNRSITRDEVRAAAAKQYEANAIDNQVLQTFLDTLIEEALLDDYATSKGIQFSEDEYLKLAAEKGLDVNISEDRQAVKYELIRQEVSESEVKSRQAFDIGYWLPPQDQVTDFGPAEKTDNASKRSQGALALTEIETRLRSGEEPIVVAKDIATKYPVLSKIIALNGYLIAEQTDDTSLLSPITYTAEDRNSGQPFYDALFLASSGDVIKTTDASSGDGSVIKVVDVNNGTFNNYSDWLTSQRTKTVKIVSPI